jgi:hypothetical protein
MPFGPGAVPVSDGKRALLRQQPLWRPAIFSVEASRGSEARPTRAGTPLARRELHLASCATPARTRQASRSSRLTFPARKSSSEAPKVAEANCRTGSSEW